MPVTHASALKHHDTQLPDSVSLGIVQLLIEEDERGGGCKGCVGSKGDTEASSGGVKGLVHVATRDCLKKNSTCKKKIIYYM